MVQIRTSRLGSVLVEFSVAKSKTILQIGMEPQALFFLEEPAFRGPPFFGFRVIFAGKQPIHRPEEAGSCGRRVSPPRLDPEGAGFGVQGFGVLSAADSGVLILCALGDLSLTFRSGTRIGTPGKGRLTTSNPGDSLVPCSLWGTKSRECLWLFVRRGQAKAKGTPLFSFFLPVEKTHKAKSQNKCQPILSGSRGKSKPTPTCAHPNPLPASSWPKRATSDAGGP